MRTILVIFDSLNRNSLGCYGGRSGLTPNIDRFANRSVIFDRHYVGGLPCMPARRDMHTGRLTFLHRAWGPLEPFDNSYCRELGTKGVYTHLVTDHAHYFEDGGAGYATAFETWDFIRGQEGDPFRGVVNPDVKGLSQHYNSPQYPLEKIDPNRFTKACTDGVAWIRMQNCLNRTAIGKEPDFPMVQCHDRALDFVERNRSADNWFLQLECFDPHEPFTAPDRYRAQPRQAGDPVLDWPYYARVTERPDEVAEIQDNYAGLVRMCDDQFGRLLDLLDRHDMWQDTCVILTTDHGFLLGEHGWWAKNRMPYYEEISHIPLIVWHPAQVGRAGRRQAVTQTPDLMPTILGLHGAEVPPEVTARSLLPRLDRDDASPRSVIFGMFAGAVGITDGRYTYYLYPQNNQGVGFNEYTLAPQRMMGPFSVPELAATTLAPPFTFTKGLKVLRVPSLPNAKRPPNDQKGGLADAETVLFDLANDPRQSRPILDPEVTDRLKTAIAGHFAQHDAPPEIYALYGLEPMIGDTLNEADA